MIGRVVGRDLLGVGGLGFGFGWVRWEIIFTSCHNGLEWHFSLMECRNSFFPNPRFIEQREEGCEPQRDRLQLALHLLRQRNAVTSQHSNKLVSCTEAGLVIFIFILGEGETLQVDT